MNRREFVGALGTTMAATLCPPSLAAASENLHIITLSFDDGFKKSFLRTAQIYEKFGLSGCFNIVAGAHLPGTVVVDDYMPREQFGDFGVWNELQDRGHEVMIHGYQHAHLARLPLEKAKELVLKSLDVFSKEFFMPRCGATFDENVTLGSTRASEHRSMIAWCCEPAKEFDLGVLRHHVLLLSARRSAQRRLFDSRMPPLAIG